MRVNLLRVDHGGESLVYASHQAYAPIGRRGCARFVTMAEQDAGYQVWRSRVLEPVEGLTAGDDEGGEHA
ncbi:hypothetical protein HK414_12950 [Ramlibacter terrae]|uniref:Uncharacterized protein n=1 Tax=Ramlibacter terrae TaxID=2732511 RepID=A0ABX6P4Q0_9BURK|nr:hypothetical protein HK414_12950 [Ramlibacter terrae]